MNVDVTEGKKVGVVSDIHANIFALDAALARLDAERVAHVVVLGDLLSYGVHVAETLARLTRLARECATTFIVGNHDQLYFEMQSGERGYYEKVPAWIQESARDTVARLDAAQMKIADAFRWQDEYVDGGVLFSHANPFAPRDWTYLSSTETRERAKRVIRERGFVAGVFGHTHRAVGEGDVWNPGSVGQPRDEAKVSSAAVVTFMSSSAAVTGGTPVPPGAAMPSFATFATFATFAIEYDERAHCDAVRASGLSAETKREILKFHRASSSDA